MVYRSKLHATLNRNFQLLPGAEWLKLLLRHVPDKGEHLVRYYGWYSNRARGERSRQRENEGNEPVQVEEDEGASADPGNGGVLGGLGLV
ncbi:Putative transposase [Thiohalomonas denitrificans]|uniref:Putative transposase n=1 Tax=Thiohalomonas denitrificans TaxID=415747 RepID=A0A1G5R2V9_9GAMM|nr:Putative transposase [Thiohalomonas denitrificans]